MPMAMALVLPVVVSAAAVWLWAMLSWAGLALHQRDTIPLADEDSLMAALRGLHIGPGVYLFPRLAPGDLVDPAKAAKWREGPVGLLTVFAPVRVRAALAATLAWNLASSALIGLVAAWTLPRGADPGRVMAVASVVGLLTYSCAGFSNLVWFQARPSAKLMHVVDGFVQGLATGAVFAAMWPGA